MTNQPDAAALADELLTSLDRDGAIEMLEQLSITEASANCDPGLRDYCLPAWLRDYCLAALRAKPSGGVVDDTTVLALIESLEATGDDEAHAREWRLRSQLADRGYEIARTRPATTESDGLRLALLQTQWLLETIVRSHSTNFKDVSERIIANRAALEHGEPPSPAITRSLGRRLRRGKNVRPASPARNQPSNGQCLGTTCRHTAKTTSTQPREIER